MAFAFSILVIISRNGNMAGVQCFFNTLQGREGEIINVSTFSHLTPPQMRNFWINFCWLKFKSQPRLHNKEVNQPRAIWAISLHEPKWAKSLAILSFNRFCMGNEREANICNKCPTMGKNGEGPTMGKNSN
ncbi:uncharacterized protein LOC132636159 [Lycium barbarum]|uniref:uncharacterized protein LOC132636159 n=1 Tax=Lycium barbarum TaxID=112863 RepID=UPI00293E29AA|nr:uncharacterized protein LOC132636159 [Lycium barbarum]